MIAHLVTKMRGDRSIREMARDTDVAASYICGMEKGKYPNPSLAIIQKLIKGSNTDVTLADFIKAIEANV